ncbi:Disease resistance protein RPS4B [Cardamine amara subsp. amara]|uniref:Disease resistance protein RPS4B n=1 Tax=Cardamine amara subsp. amara TaxID=228776 RepID=A0ABD1BMM0_CARAN
MAGSSTIEQLPPQHQVFINFRGQELRRTFVSHLVNALKSNGINVFVDMHAGRGGIELLLKRIEESRIALVIISQRYTESTWCLRELAKIKDCVDETKLVAIPIFYKLDPSTVGHLRGEFGDAFRDLKESDAMEKKEWKNALKWIPSLMGITIDDKSDEGETLQEIVENVKILLAKITSEGSQEASVD